MYEARQDRLHMEIREALKAQSEKAFENLGWLYANMNPYFFITMKEETQAIANLCRSVHELSDNRKIVLADREKALILARLNLPGSLYDTLKAIREREISYAEFTHSYDPAPGCAQELEIQRFEFDRKTETEIAYAGEVRIPADTRQAISQAMKRLYPRFAFVELHKLLRLLWLNNEHYVRISPPERVARVLWLFQQGRRHDGLYLDLESTEDVVRRRESRVIFSVGNPPLKDFLAQVLEVFHRLDIGVFRSYCLNISTGVHPYFFGTFYVRTRQGELLDKQSDLFRHLKKELYNTQILSTSSKAYTDFVAGRIMAGEEASLTNAFISFCHTNLAHNQPDRFALEAVKAAFHLSPGITLKLVDLFKAKFDPDLRDRDGLYRELLAGIGQAIQEYNTGKKYLDEVRKTIFQTCLLLIRYTLKTNFFVPEKHALAFRLDPAYLAELGPQFTSDLPSGTPFRVTFFFGRHGAGYHIGFSDIARGGWRTILCSSQDEYVTNANTLFREVFVLAHTQHLKNKDIYEGGSKLTVVLDAQGLDSPDAVIQRLYKLQYGFLNAFLDVFVTEKGKAKNARVVDYYGEDEPIELGPDENMHDAMIELIARQAVKRGYLLGIGIMSSKKVGINHKEYGVTSRGVVKFAEIAMRELGVDMHRDAFGVKITGGTNGDVAGNAMRLLLERCPKVRINSIVAGTGALYDPDGASLEELGRLLLARDVTDFDPEALHPGGFLLFRRGARQEGLTELYRKLLRTEAGLEEQWVTTDELHREMDDLIFSVPAELFLPCGGRPETIDSGNWHRLFLADGTPTAKVISEGANSYITPEAREEIQKRGVVVLRDASANKCGVISSSYEIIANLLMKEKEFLENKEAYVKDVLAILDRRAEEEATLIFRRHRESDGKLLYTDISRAISTEINSYYAQFFDFFRSRPQLCQRPLYRKVLLRHLPAFIRENPRFRSRIKNLPAKIQYAILASEIASYIVYHDGWQVDFESSLSAYAAKHFGGE